MSTLQLSAEKAAADRNGPLTTPYVLPAGQPMPATGGRFIDPIAESAVVGTIATGLFSKIPESKLIPPRTFYDERWRIIYGAAYSLRMAGAAVCAGRVSDIIELHRQDGVLQKAIDPTKTFQWRDWPNHCDQSLALSPSTLPVEYSLETLGELFEKRESLEVARRIESGELAPRDAIEALRKITPESRWLPPMVSADELCASPPPTPPEIIEGILHQGSKMALGGGSKSFKTWTLIELSICIATGREWLGFATTQGRVLYLNFELPAFSIEKRIREIREAMGIADTGGNLTLWNLRGHAAEAATILPIISREAKRHGFALMVLDPLYKLQGEREENATHHMAAIMNTIERVAVETGASAPVSPARSAYRPGRASAHRRAPARCDRGRQRSPPAVARDPSRRRHRATPATPLARRRIASDCAPSTPALRRGSRR
jgi:hypothetical protein